MSKICRTFAPEFENETIMKKNYNQPEMQVMAMMPSAIVMAGSPSGIPVGDSLSGEGD